MEFKYYNIGLVLRIVLMVLVVFLAGSSFAWIGSRDLLFLPIVTSLVLIAQVIELVIYLKRMGREISRFINNIDHQDLSEKFDEKSAGQPFRSLYRSLNNVINRLESMQVEKQAQFNYLKIIMESIHTGIISVREDGEIVLINEYARDILGLPAKLTWAELDNKHPALVSEIDKIHGRGNRLVEIRAGDMLKQLSVNLSTIKILNTGYRVVTFQDIRTEIEQKEIEAWHKLVQILRHEIRNSVTPIASMTETILMLLEDQDGNTRNLKGLQETDLADIHSSVRTIHGRSERLFDFVEKYRELTKLPPPRLETILLNELLAGLVDMLGSQAEGAEILFMKPGKDHTIQADRGMIEQALINLARNSIQALAGREDGRIILSAECNNKQVLVFCEDNGPGIEAGILEDIFLPFYTTRDEGTGIGLSISRQIMNLHGGTITAESRPWEKTRFSLVFNQDLCEEK
jgi:nitrogen fixation/metabolism regulation signal transduction histidine kinase